MKKLLSALLIATMLIASVTCALAVSAEETSPVIYNLLSEIKAADTADVTVVVNDNGTVTVTPKRDIDANTPATIVTAFEGGKFDATKQTYLAVDIACEITDIDFRLHYTRKDKLADQFWTGMRTDGNAAYAAAKTETSVVWNVTKYLTDNDKLNADNMHQYTDLVITVGKKDKPITFNTLALISDASALKPGEPLVKPAATEDPTESTTTETTTTEATSSEASSSETTTTAESSSEAPASSSSEAPASSSSTAPGTGDTGMIVFAVLAVLAVVGGVAVVRVRH